MHIKSPYPPPPDLPPNEPLNVFNVMFNRPDQKEWTDFTLYVDSTTGKKLKYSAYRKRMEYVTTALGAPISKGGLGLGIEGGTDLETRDDGTLVRPVKEMVGIMSENSSDYSVLVNSLLAGTIPYALISAYSTRFELLHALKLTHLTRLFVQAKHLPLVVPAAKEVGIPMDRIYVIDGGDHEMVQGHTTLFGLIEGVHRKVIPPVGVRPAKMNTLAYLIFSSGTSGLPKAVMITHGSLASSLLQFATVLQSNTNPPPVLPTPEGIPIGLGFLPMHHVYGLGTYCQRNWFSPATFIMIPRWSVNEALRIIKKYGLTHLNLVPAALHQLVHHPDITKDHFKTLIAATCGAAYTPSALVDQFQKYLPVQIDFLLGYGMSEATYNASGQPPDGVTSSTGKPLHKTHGEGAIGVLNAGTEARILREDGTDADVGEVGEFYVKGGNVVPGYWENSEANRETFVRFDDEDGRYGGRWLRTGDRMWSDADGALFYADRSKDTLKVSGSQVSPVEIENVLLAHPEKLITDVTVAGVTPNDLVVSTSTESRKELGEKVPRAWVVLSEAGKRLGEQNVLGVLDRWHRESLSRYKWLRGGIGIVQEIPKNPTGKTLRRVLVDEYERDLKSRRSKL
ncbi:putative NRPS-like protein biosynthetic cluster [Marasmius oreades]|uniref:NRPS-like protein biosynthetic cluster n=1 Tax=Marasmius oreades TaxID=181124 RepID=A0A9P7UT97_9AGAR|nr:putative NRPS-like protein biosynthetic cluster [Marasmius oreades]KAG7092990.1 putative NRPS-like protein biosynthetic cluster [Marasmius oreades]